MACLLLINVFGQGVLNMLSRFGFAPQIWPGFTPARNQQTDHWMLDSFERLCGRPLAPVTGGLRTSTTAPPGRPSSAWSSLSAYAALATLLTWHTLHRFEIVAGTGSPLHTPHHPLDANEQIAVPTSNQHQVVDANA